MVIKKGTAQVQVRLSVFGYQMRFDLRKGFPLLTTKEDSISFNSK